MYKHKPVPTEFSPNTKYVPDVCLYSMHLVYKHFQYCSSFAHLSTAIKVSDTNTSNPEEFRKYFPKFMWLLRDVVNLPCNEEEEEIPLIAYIQDEVLKRTGQKAYDSVVTAISTLFPQPLMCDWLPYPNDDPGSLSLEDEGNIDKDFITRSAEIIKVIKASVIPKCGYGEMQAVTGADLAELAMSYIDAINKKDTVPSLEGSWKAVIKLKLAKEADILVASYEEEMNAALDGEEPVNESNEEADCRSSARTLMDIHEAVFAEKRQALVEKVRQLLPNPSRSSRQAEESEVGKVILKGFESSIVEKDETREKVKAGVLHKFITLNHKKSETYCIDLWKNLEQEHEIDNKYARALNQYNPQKCAEVQKCLQTVREEYNSKAIGPAQPAVFTARNGKWEDREKVLESIPGPPTNVAIVGKARDAIKLQWDEPCINPAAATKYIVEYRRGTSAWVKDTETAERWHIVRKLKSNTEYEFRVLSWNDEAEKVKKSIEEVLRGNKREGIKMGTRLGRLARAMLSTMGFLGGTAVAPLLSAVGVPALAMESERKAALAACVTIPFFATLGAPIVGAKVAYHVIQETGDYGDLEERYVPQKSEPETQSD